jgi:hypothetical protein
MTASLIPKREKVDRIWAKLQVGKRIELHPGTDLWMRGARFGTVLSITPKGLYRVKLDKWPKVIAVPQDRLKVL